MCRFIPTCSEYAIIVLQHHGLFRALYYIAWRFLRCNPFNGNQCMCIDEPVLTKSCSSNLVK